MRDARSPLNDARVWLCYSCDFQNGGGENTFINEKKAFFCPLGTFSKSQFVISSSPIQSVITML